MCYATSVDNVIQRGIQIHTKKIQFNVTRILKRGWAIWNSEEKNWRVLISAAS